MRRRLYFMLPDVEHCRALVAELKADQGMSDQDIHVMARQDISLDGLHEASVVQKSELSYGLEMGLGIGGIAGMLGGLMVIVFPPAGVVLGGGATLLATTLAGAGFGSLVSALVTQDIPNHELDAYQDRISKGEILLMLDIPTPQVDTMIELIKTHHPEADVGVSKIPQQSDFSQMQGKA